MAYNDFADVYDSLMSDCPYDRWTAFIIKNAGGAKEAVDGACGTGNIAIRLAKKGIKTAAFDLSESMLRYASEKSRAEGVNILYSCQNLINFTHVHMVDMVTVCCDGINYLTEDGELEACFKAVGATLKKNGRFIFDISSAYKLKSMDGEMYGQDGENISYIWLNSMDGNILELALSFFVKRDNGLYKRFDEVQLQRAYSEVQIMEALEKAGMACSGIYDDYTDQAARKDSLRLTFIARKI